VPKRYKRTLPVRKPLSDEYSEKFLETWVMHEWPEVETDNYTNTHWTEEMSIILDKTAEKLQLKRKRTELRRMDFNWYDEKSDTPILTVEHENGYKGIWKEEIPKLLLSKASLKVLICYPPEEKCRSIVYRLLNLLKKEFQYGKFREEFLLMLGKPRAKINNPKEFRFYRYAPSLSVEEI